MLVRGNGKTRNPVISGLQMRSCSVESQTLNFLKSMPESIFGSQLARPSSQFVLIHFLFGHRFIHHSESSPCPILEGLEKPHFSVSDFPLMKF